MKVGFAHEYIYPVTTSLDCLSLAVQIFQYLRANLFGFDTRPVAVLQAFAAALQALGVVKQPRPLRTRSTYDQVQLL